MTDQLLDIHGLRVIVSPEADRDGYHLVHWCNDWPRLMQLASTTSDEAPQEIGPEAFDLETTEYQA